MIAHKVVGECLIASEGHRVECDLTARRIKAVVVVFKGEMVGASCLPIQLGEKRNIIGAPRPLPEIASNRSQRIRNLLQVCRVSRAARGRRRTETQRRGVRSVSRREYGRGRQWIAIGIVEKAGVKACKGRINY